MILWDTTTHQPQDDEKKDDLVTFNISGERIKTYVQVLERFPDSPLARIAQYVRTHGCKEEIFIDRHPECFRAIIDYLRTGKLHYPPSVCGNKFREELLYWKIYDRFMQKCCVSDYVTAVDSYYRLKVFSKYLARAKICRMPVKAEGMSRINYWRMVIWKTIMVPTYSRAALIYNIVTSTLLLLNVVIIMVQSVLAIQPVQSFHNETLEHPDNCKTLFAPIFMGKTTITLFWLDVVFSTFFTLEIIARIAVAPSLKWILKSISTYIEILSLVPFYLLCYVVIHHEYSGTCPQAQPRVVRILFILRVARIFRLCFGLRHYTAFRAFMYTVKSSVRELLILFSLVTLNAVWMGTIVSLLETAHAGNNGHSEFENILSGLWWALITSTTVGYGDVVPASPLGRILTVFVALSGIMVIALATPSVSENFSLISTYLMGNSHLTGPDEYEMALIKEAEEADSKSQDEVDDDDADIS